ncbi:MULTISPECIES: DUF3021 domain-containing protein [Mammaliicoccus]|uniref:DUF3021 domain-containing protein n=1 Tax=Mammaliicoccus fleurettii TaxID=150056 RepID=A0ABS5MM55_9STAP|nr:MULTISPECIES: DUF3021 domain-containing protein [Mammaliicoccus]HCN60830.1 DUF3021 domain-containing protein [Staphylococcus sp.]MBL0847226.1 DUF3021 domain-containing protein [Mammaliicoccus fleurettii]MBS3672128.1 DUF3021 domain-containing protein [Mammaliicoccus fleurettii]MBS3696976.1 DUF3021 domain-containing protein [Mammaliicoccus fleurettii]MEB6201716.1 DUF3021 domain-containing protein [Mammaliicoccus fleurettii]
MNKILKSTLQGIGIGSSIMLIFIAIFNVTIDFLDVISVYLFGAICGFLPIVYEFDNLPLPIKLIIHLGGSVIAFFILSTINHWVPLQPEPLIGALTIFTLIFLVIWFIFLIFNAQQSKKINTKLKNM